MIYNPTICRHPDETGSFPIFYLLYSQGVFPCHSPYSLTHFSQEWRMDADNKNIVCGVFNKFTFSMLRTQIIQILCKLAQQ